MDRLHRIGRRVSPSVGEATGLVTQKLYADGQGPCYTYTDDGNLATRTWARGVTTSYTYDAWGSLTSTTYSDGTPVATRPLYWQPRTSQGNFSLFYTHDGNKNVSEAVFYQRARGVAAHDEYAPFGEVTAQTRVNAWGTLDQATDNPWRFSCEYADVALGLVYYNDRHYDSRVARWFRREPMLDIELDTQSNNHNPILYGFVQNDPVDSQDYLGLVKIEHKCQGALTTGASNCLGGAMTGQGDQYRYPNNDSLRNASFIAAMLWEGWVCNEVKSMDECKNKECYDKILIALYLNIDENNIGKNPWTDPSFDWDYQGKRTDSYGRKKTDLHAIRYDSEKGRYKQIPHASYEPQSFDNNIDKTLFKDVPLLCCHKKIITEK